MKNEEVYNKIVKEIINMKKGQIFTFDELFKQNNIDDFQTKFEMTSDLYMELKDLIEVHPEDKNQFLGVPFVFRYIKK